jgi:hypothetical protein
VQVQVGVILKICLFLYGWKGLCNRMVAVPVGDLYRFLNLKHGTRTSDAQLSKRFPVRLEHHSMCVNSSCPNRYRAITILVRAILLSTGTYSHPNIHRTLLRSIPHLNIRKNITPLAFYFSLSRSSTSAFLSLSAASFSSFVASYATNVWLKLRGFRIK